MGDINVSAGHLAPAGGGFEPQRSFNWTVIIPGIDDPELIRLSAERVGMPNISTGVMLLRYQNENVKVSGTAVVAANSIVCRDFVDRKTLATLNKWMEQVHDPATGAIGYASEYKKSATLQLIDVHGDVKRQVTAKGCWPSGLQFTELSYESDDIVKITMTLQVDKYLMEL